MNTQHSSTRRRSLVGALLLTGTAVFAACEPIGSPSEVTPQLAPGDNFTNVQFQVKRGDTGAPVAYATVSVYLTTATAPVPCANGATVSNQNCWLTTDVNGVASINVPSNQPLGYLIRSVSPEWMTLASQVIPPVSAPATLTGVDNDLGAVTCGSGGPVTMTPGLLQLCVTNRYVTPRGVSEVVAVSLPVLNSRAVEVRTLNGSITTGATAYLVEALPTNLPWQTVPSGGKAGFLRYIGTGANVPGAAGFVEVYGQSPEGFEFAGTQEVTAGGTTAIVETSPVICANPVGQPDVEFSISQAPSNPKFSFTEARWAYTAKRGTIAQSLVKDLTTTAVVVEFVQTSGNAEVEFTQRLRTAMGGSFTASATLNCTNGLCTLASTSAPGAGNPLTPLVYTPKAGKVFFVVKGIGANDATEWSVKASGQGVSQQFPIASKSKTSSAFLLFSKAFQFCDPDFSFDGVWGCEI